jgi:hypothetical protein
MKKINLKKLVLKKTNITELTSDQARLIVGGSTIVAAPDQTDPRSMYSMFCIG